MQLADVNVLIGAFRTDSPLHEPCSRWLKQAISRGEPLGFSRLILSAVIRNTTNRRTHPTPARLKEAIGYVNDLVDLPNASVVEPGRRHWPIFIDLLMSTGTIGPDVSDAWFAALAIESNCEWISFDGDFARYPGLKWRRP